MLYPVKMLYHSGLFVGVGKTTGFGLIMLT